MFTRLGDIGNSLISFFRQVSAALKFDLIFAIALVVEVFLIFIFLLKVYFSYELRLRRAIDRANSWLFKNKKITNDNIKEFNTLVKKGAKRFTYYWQQYILYRENPPTYYLSLDNLVEKPLKASGFSNNVRNLNISTVLWALAITILSVAWQAEASANTLRTTELLASIMLPIMVLIIGFIASIIIQARKSANIDEIYHLHHIFSRFIDNACVDLPPFIDYDLLFSPKEIEKGNAQLREYYESRARKAKEEFENAKQGDIEYVEYNFRDAGIDGSLVLERAMKESETFMNKKSNTLAKIAHVDAQKEALKRNYENVQKDLQRKIQASKENIQKLIQQQEATTNRMEVGFLRKQQEQEISKQESLQAEYDQEETRYVVSNEELNQEIAQLSKKLDDAKEDVQKAMVAEYQTFYEKIMKSAYAEADNRVKKEKEALRKEKDANEKELIIVQTQIKRLIDENDTLRARLNESPSSEQSSNNDQNSTLKGVYDDKGNYVYENGAYHDANGLYHDVDGKIYDFNGTLISEPEDNAKTKGEEQVKEETLAKEESEQPQESEYNPNANIMFEDVSTEELFGKEKTEENKEEINETDKEGVSEKKKRGRPRKTTAEKVNSMKPAGEKKPRGRPRKSAQSAEKVEEKTTTPKTTKLAKKSSSKKTTKSPAKKSVQSSSKKNTTAKKKTTEKKTTAKKPAAKTTKTIAKKTTTRKPRKTKTADIEEPKFDSEPIFVNTMVSEKDGLPTKKKPKPKSKTTKPKADEDLDIVNLAKINKLITEEEERLSKMKALVNSEITDALAEDSQKDFTNESEKIMKEVEELKARAEKARQEGQSEQELASINSRIEALIKEISNLNDKSDKK